VVIKLAASAAIFEAVHSYLNGTPSLHAKDCNEFVRELLTPIHVHLFSYSFASTSFRSHIPFSAVVVSIGGSLVRGSTLGGISCAGSVEWENIFVLLAWSLPAFSVPVPAPCGFSGRTEISIPYFVCMR